MHHRPLRRAIALSLAALLAFAGVAAADTVRADGDITTPVVDLTATLGAVAPGSVHEVNIGFVLTCANGSHLDAGPTVTVTYAGAERARRRQDHLRVRWDRHGARDVAGRWQAMRRPGADVRRRHPQRRDAAVRPRPRA